MVDHISSCFIDLHANPYISDPVSPAQSRQIVFLGRFGDAKRSNPWQENTDTSVTAKFKITGAAQVVDLLLKIDDIQNLKSVEIDGDGRPVICHVTGRFLEEYNHLTGKGDTSTAPYVSLKCLCPLPTAVENLVLIVVLSKKADIEAHAIYTVRKTVEPIPHSLIQYRYIPVNFSGGGDFNSMTIDIGRGRGAVDEIVIITDGAPLTDVSLTFEMTYRFWSLSNEQTNKIFPMFVYGKVPKTLSYNIIPFTYQPDIESSLFINNLANVYLRMEMSDKTTGIHIFIRSTVGKEKPKPDVITIE